MLQDGSLGAQLSQGAESVVYRIVQREPITDPDVIFESSARRKDLTRHNTDPLQES